MCQIIRNMEKAGKNSDAQLLIRLPSGLKTALQREAFANGRTLTAEVNYRLQRSLEESQHASSFTAHIQPASGHEPLENGLQLSATDHAMLDVFHKMPVEKQLALLSLFK